MKIRAGIVIGLIAILTPFAMHADEEPDPCGGLPCPPPPGITVTAENIATTTTENTALTIFLIATTSDGSPVTFSIVNTDNANGSVGEPSGDEVLYTPDLDYVGEASFTYRASSGETDSADATVTITVEAAPESEEEGFDIEGTISLSNGCAVEDSTATIHYYPISTSTQYLAICALQEALDENIVENIEFQDFGFGLFVNSVNEVTETNAYWKLHLNDVGADVGAADLAVADGDTISLVLTAFDPDTFEETPLDYSLTIHIDGLESDFLNVIVPNMCTVSATSSDDVELSAEHDFPIDSSPSDYLGVCALVAARDDGHIENFGFIDFGFGLFLDSIDGIVTDADFDPFWALAVNEVEAMVGITDIGVEIGDILTLTYAGDTSVEYDLRVIGLNEIVIVDEEEPEEEEEETPAPSGGGGGGGGITHLTFNVPLAISYITSQQKANGSFENDLLTDWTALAFSAYDAGAAKTSLRNFLTTYSPSLTSATDYERHAMALMALGIDPYSGAGRDFISPIVNYFDGTQVGDAALVNDDIFALFPLTHAGYSASDEIIQKVVAFIVAAQQSNGSWVGGVDVTAAAVQALAPFASQPGVSTALTNAQSYLRGQQQTDGGFSNGFATSWSMQAIAALGQTESQWSSSTGYYPTDYLASLQQTDGGVEPTSTSATNRVWATAYAVPGALAKSWNSLLTSFSKPASTPAGGSTTVTTAATTTATTTAQAAATTTPLVATSTPPLIETATSSGEVLSLAIEAVTFFEESVPQEVVEEIAEAVETLVEEVGTSSVPTESQLAAAAQGFDEQYYFLFALLVLLAYGFAWYTLSWRKYWK